MQYASPQRTQAVWGCCACSVSKGSLESRRQTVRLYRVCLPAALIGYLMLLLNAAKFTGRGALISEESPL